MIYKVYPRKKDKNVVRIYLLLSFHIIERGISHVSVNIGKLIIFACKDNTFPVVFIPELLGMANQNFFLPLQSHKNKITYLSYCISTAPLAHLSRPPPLQEELHNKRGIIYISHRNKPIESISYANLVEKACAPFKFKCPGLL